MKRDWTIIRTILCDVEKLPVHKFQPYSQDEDGDDVTGHALMLTREGYIVGEDTLVSVKADSLTMRGHDLLARLRNRNGDGPVPLP